MQNLVKSNILSRLAIVESFPDVVFTVFESFNVISSTYHNVSLYWH